MKIKAQIKFINELQSGKVCWPSYTSKAASMLFELPLLFCFYLQQNKLASNKISLLSLHKITTNTKF